MGGFETFLEQILDMENPPEVISISYGTAEIVVRVNPALKTSFDTAAMKLGAQGVSILAASGDDGAQNLMKLPPSTTCSNLHEDDPKLGKIGLQVNWPASSPYVTAV